MGKKKTLLPGAYPTQKLPQAEGWQRKRKYHFDDSHAAPPVELETIPDAVPSTSKKCKVVSVIISEQPDNSTSNLNHSSQLETSCPETDPKDMTSMDTQSEYHDVPDMVDMDIKQEIIDSINDQMEEECLSQSDDQGNVIEYVHLLDDIKSENIEEDVLFLDDTTGQIVNMESYENDEPIEDAENESDSCLLNSIEDNLKSPEKDKESRLSRSSSNQDDKKNTCSQPVTRTLYKCSKCDFGSLKLGKVESHVVERHNSERVIINEIRTVQNVSLKIPKPNVYTVGMLQNIQFSFLPLDGKLHLLKIGRPMPKNEHLKQELYDKYDWLCGCALTSKYFCFPCLLFDKNPTGGLWVRCGVLYSPRTFEAHVSSLAHLNSLLELKLLNKKCATPDDSNQCSTKEHNERVKRNRMVLLKIINCIKFCTAFSLPIDGSYGTEGLMNGLMNLNSEINVFSKEPFEFHSKNQLETKDTLETIQNELLDMILQVCQEHIKTEIAKAQFVSLILDEIADVSSKFGMAVVLRYLLRDGTPVERFWGFVDSCQVKDSGDDLAASINKILVEVLDFPEKLIAQSYNGVSFMSGRFPVVHKLIQENYKYAYYVHCYSVDPSVIISHATKRNLEGKVFISTLVEIANFLLNMSEEIELDLRLSETFRNDFGQKLNMVSKKVFEKKTTMILTMKKIMKESKLIETIKRASAIHRMLLDPAFIYWNTVFRRLNERADWFLNKLKPAKANPKLLSEALRSFNKDVQKYIHQLHDDPVSINSFDQVKNSTGKCMDANILRVSRATQVCDTVIKEFNMRFSVQEHFFASFLLFPEMFIKFQNMFPINCFTEVVRAYPFIDKSKLKTELTLIYQKPNFRQMSGPVDILKFMIESDLLEFFPTTHQLLQIIITTPMVVIEEQRKVSTVNKVRRLLEKRIMNEDRQAALIMLPVEKKMVYKMVNFNESVIEKFSSQKHRKNDFAWTDSSS